MNDQKTNPNLSVREQFEAFLDEAREVIASARETLNDTEEVQLKDVDTFLESLSEAAAKLDTADAAIDQAQFLVSDVGTLTNDDIEHVLRALKHLGLNDVDLFNMADIKMALEATVGL